MSSADVTTLSGLSSSSSSDTELDPERLARTDARAMLGVIRAATDIAAGAEVVLREAGSGLHASEWDVLAALYAFGPMRPAEIVRRCWMSANTPTVHAILGRLEERGLITKGPHPEHARGVLVALSEDGTSTVEDLFPKIERKVIRAFANDYSDAELEMIAELMERH